MISHRSSRMIRLIPARYKQTIDFVNVKTHLELLMKNSSKLVNAKLILTELKIAQYSYRIVEKEMENG